MSDPQTTKSPDAAMPLGASGASLNSQHGNAPSPGDTQTTLISLKLAQAYAHELARYVPRCEGCGVAEKSNHAADCYFFRKAIEIMEGVDEAA